MNTECLERLVANIITPIYGGRATVTFKEGNHVYTVAVPERGINDLWQPSVTGIIRVLSKADVLVPWSIGEVIKQVKLTLQSDANSSVSKELVYAILEASKEAWKARRGEAADIGTYVHNFLEAEMKYRARVQNPYNPQFELFPEGPPVLLSSNIPEEYFEPVRNSISAGLKFFDEHQIELVQAEAPRWSPTYGFIGTGDLIAKVDGKLTVVDYKTSKRLYDTVFLQLAAYQLAYEEEFPDQKIEQRLAINVGRDGRLETKSRDNQTLQSDVECFLSLLTAWRWDRQNQGVFSKSAPAVVGALS
jgi:hypothetical protein